jgi:hypothetical protein
MSLVVSFFFFLASSSSFLLVGRGEPKGGVLVQTEVNLPCSSRAYRRASFECLLQTMMYLNISNSSKTWDIAVNYHIIM